MRINNTEVVMTVNGYDYHSVPAFIVEGHGQYSTGRLFRIRLSESEARRIAQRVADLDASRQATRDRLAAIRVAAIQARVAAADKAAAYRGNA